MLQLLNFKISIVSGLSQSNKKKKKKCIQYLNLINYKEQTAFGFMTKPMCRLLDLSQESTDRVKKTIVLLFRLALNCYSFKLHPQVVVSSKHFSVDVVLFCLGNGRLRNLEVGQARGFILPNNNFHSLGFNCPANLICSLLNFLFAYHIPPRHPNPYLEERKKNRR